MSHTTIPTPVLSSQQRWAMIALITGGIAIGSSPIFVRLSEVGPLATGFWRLALAALPLLLMDGRERHERKDAAPLTLADCLRLALPGFFIAADLGAWHLSLHSTSVANATLLANMAPIFVTIGAWLLFRSRVSSSFIVGLVVAVAGVIVLKGGPGELLHSRSSGDAMALLAAVFYAGYILSVGRLRSRFSTMRIMLWSSAIAAIFSLPVAYFMEGHILPATLYGWLILAGLAWLTHAAGQSMIAYALAFLPASFSSLTLLLQPVVAAFLAWTILSEPIGLMQAIGGVIVISGILIARRG
ncbi:transporter, DME family [Brucella sp. BO2]|uniref:DMT family transporter n=1 Tax=Brucella sp. BO2 TaxID=693750 RepID=UPI0001E44725|nr:DMT family transporter [Brucella sp. BO2]EFM60522.1 transporter, DME family [Brucella sp. BO2]QPN28124.1 DMT family transporter [Brucella sp. BO2]